MIDLHGALVALADRGTPTGSQLLRERVAVDLAGDRRRQWPAPPPRGLRLAVGAAIAVIVILGGALLLSQLTSNDTVTEPTVVTTAPSPDTTQPTPDAGPLPGFTPGAWGRVGADTMQPVVGLFDMTVVGSRMVGIGFDPGENFRQDGVIFASDDGETWTRLAEDDPALTLGAVLMYGVTEGGPGIVAVGMGCENEEEGCGPYMTAWTSVDGTSWTRSPFDPEVFGDPASQSSAAFAATTTTDGLIVAVGSMEDWVLTDEGEVESITARPVVWTSTDGLAWERNWEGNDVTMTMDQYLEASPVMQAVASGPDGLLVGVGSAVDDGVSVAAVWTSSDGSTWQRVPHDPATFAGAEGEGAWVLDVAAGDSGLAAVGSAAGTPAVWTSPDGLSWARVASVDDEFDGSFSSVAALGTGFVAAGPHGFADMGEAPLTLWTSPDGLEWNRVLVLGQGYAQAIVATETGVAVAGGLPEDDDFHAGVWTGLAFDPLTPPAPPGLPPPTTLPAPTVEGAAGVGDLAEGVACADLAADGFNYAAAVAYWARWDNPVDLDPDGNGVPCEDDYSPSDVSEVYGPAEALAVEFVSDSSTMTFTASGPAVEAGMVCASWTAEYLTDGPPYYGGAVYRWEDQYTCDDGSGTFVIATDMFIETQVAGVAVWTVLPGTGKYESVRGGGAFQSDWVEGIDTLTGRIIIDAGE